MLKSNHKAKTQINQSYNPNIWSNIILNIFHQSNRKIKVNDQKMKWKEEDHIHTWTRTVNLTTEKHDEIKCLWNFLGFVDLLETNNFCFWITQFWVRMKKIWRKQDTKNCKKNSDFEFCFLKMYGREWEVLKEIRVRETKDQNAPYLVTPVWIAWATRG